MFVAIFFAALALADANVCADDATSVWCQFDLDGNGKITLDELHDINGYTNIWGNAMNDGQLSQTELNEHKQHFAGIWDTILKTFHSLDQDDDEYISMADFQEMEKDIEDAEAALAAFNDKMTSAEFMIGQNPKDIQISFTELEELKKDSVSTFNTRISAAFNKLGGNDNRNVSSTALNEYTDDIALLYSVMESTMNHNKATNGTGLPGDVEVPKQLFIQRKGDLAARDSKLYQLAQTRNCFEDGTCDSNTASISEIRNKDFGNSQ
jgi:archaellum component FlaC